MSLRIYTAKKAGIHVCSSPFSSPDNVIFLHSRNIECLPVAGIDTKIGKVGSGAIVSLEERWGGGRLELHIAPRPASKPPSENRRND